MTVFARVRRAWPTTFSIHVFQMLLAGTFALPLAWSLQYPEIRARESVAAWISAMTLGASFGEHTARHAILPLLAASLNYPWLSVAWLRALEQPGTFYTHARAALRRYRAACTVALATLLSLAALAAAAYFTALWTGRLLWHLVDQRELDLLRLASTVPFAVLALFVVTLQDAAYAALSSGGIGGHRVLRTAIAAVSARLVALRGAVILVQLAIGLTAWLAPRLAFGAGGAADLAVFVATQVGALLLTCTRATWLARLLASAAARPQLLT